MMQKFAYSIPEKLHNCLILDQNNFDPVSGVKWRQILNFFTDKNQQVKVMLVFHVIYSKSWYV